MRRGITQRLFQHAAIQIRQRRLLNLGVFAHTAGRRRIHQSHIVSRGQYRPESLRIDLCKTEIALFLTVRTASEIHHHAQDFPADGIERFGIEKITLTADIKGFSITDGIKKIL